MIADNRPHWSTCPKCGRDRHATDGRKGVRIARTGVRLPDMGAILYWLRCKPCDHVYKALRPD